MTCQWHETQKRARFTSEIHFVLVDFSVRRSFRSHPSRIDSLYYELGQPQYITRSGRSEVCWTMLSTLSSTPIFHKICSSLYMFDLEFIWIWHTSLGTSGDWTFEFLDAGNMTANFSCRCRNVRSLGWFDENRGPTSFAACFELLAGRPPPHKKAHESCQTETICNRIWEVSKPRARKDKAAANEPGHTWTIYCSRDAAIPVDHDESWSWFTAFECFPLRRPQAWPTHCSTLHQRVEHSQHVLGIPNAKAWQKNDETCRKHDSPLLSFAPNDPTWSYLLTPWCHVCYCMFILFTLYCEYFSNVNMAMSSPPVPVRELQHLCDQHTSMQLPAPFYGSDLCIYALNMLNVGETLSSCHHTPSYPISALGCQILSLLCSSSSFSTVQGWPMPWNGDITWYSHLFLSDDLLTVAFSYLDLFRLQVQVVGFQGLRNCSSSGRYFAASQLNLHWTADKPWPAWQASSTFQGHPGELGRYSWVLSNAAKDVRVWHLFILFRK